MDIVARNRALQSPPVLRAQRQLDELIERVANCPSCGGYGQHGVSYANDSHDVEDCCSCVPEPYVEGVPF